MIGRRHLLLGALAAGAAAACGGRATGRSRSSAHDDLGFAGTVLADPVGKPTVTFTDTSGAPFDLRTETAGRLTLLLFGYTNCPDVCPIHLGVLAGALAHLDGTMAKPTVLFVGVDTARDTPERLRSYLATFDRDFIGLSAPLEAQWTAQDQLGLARTVIGEPDASGSYTVGHPSHFVAFTPDDLCHLVYPFGVRQQDWVNDLPRLASFDWGAVR